jgi:hypothetical protein
MSSYLAMHIRLTLAVPCGRRVSREISLNELETAHITFEPKVLTFGLGPNDRSPVDHELHDVLTLTNYGAQTPTPHNQKRFS